MDVIPKIRFKKNTMLFDLLYIPTVLHIMMLDFAQKALEIGCPPIVITRIIDEEIEGVSTSTTHSEKRACDIRSWGHTDEQTKILCDYMNEKYKNIAAISASDLKPRACVYHDASLGPHYHLQISQKAKESQISIELTPYLL